MNNSEIRKIVKKYSYIFEESEDYGYIAYAKELPSLRVDDKSIEKASLKLENLLIAGLHALLEDGDPIPQPIKNY